ncbi:MAG: HAMP domain-containing histidine kinase [Kiritimatiellae bacterium]|nr:HAMP domain-containing histidine kinase [Kiritimatiellia bacterium]
MRNLRLACSCTLLSLPAAAVCALGIWFIADRALEIAKAERARVKAEYRERALALRQDAPENAQILPKLPKGWKAAGKMSPGRWGFEASETEATVWYDDGETVRAMRTMPVRETDYKTMITFFGSLFLLVLVAMTVAGIGFFVGHMRARDDFLAATAHDLSTPLAGLRLLVAEDGDARHLVERLIRLVANIREFLALGGRRPPPKKERFDLVAAYGEAYAIFAEDYRDLFGGADVEMSGAASLPATGDEAMTVQILWNLLGNDLKYAAPYGKVRARFSASDGFAWFELADEGKGMTKREMSKAFDRYYRAKTVLESGKGGFGIGLCTARDFAERMGGALTVEANSPSGCIFRLKLPA